MELRKLLVIPTMMGALALGACGGEDEGLGEAEVGVEEGVVGEGVVEGGAVGATEILGNGIDDDGDGLIDEEA